MALSKPAVICPRSVDALRPLKIIGIGAGPSGILSAIRLSQGIQQMDLVIYDKNAEIGGTWYENRYPGCSCGWNVPSSQETAEHIRYPITLLSAIFRIQSRMELVLCRGTGNPQVLEASRGKVWIEKVHQAIS